MAPLSSTLCSRLVDIAAASGDVSLVNVVLECCLPRLKDMREAIPWLAAIELSLDLVERLTNFEAQNHLAQFAAEKLREVPVASLVSSSNFGQLWQRSITCRIKAVSSEMENVLNQVGGEFLGHTVNTLSSYVDESSPRELRAAFAAIAARRCQWLKQEVAFIEGLPPDFPRAAAIVEFIESPKKFFIVQGCFADTAASRSYAGTLRTRIRAPIVVTASGSGRQARVDIFKAGATATSAPCVEDLTPFKDELSLIEQLLHRIAPSNTGKRPRMK